jgi:hypothetical protein
MCIVSIKMQNGRKKKGMGYSLSNFILKTVTNISICTFHEEVFLNCVECDINVNNEHSNVSFLERKGTYVDF